MTTKITRELLDRDDRYRAQVQLENKLIWAVFYGCIKSRDSITAGRLRDAFGSEIEELITSHIDSLLRCSAEFRRYLKQWILMNVDTDVQPDAFGLVKDYFGDVWQQTIEVPISASLNYKARLRHPKWQKKRLEVFQHNSWKCTKCGAADKTLHVHHLNYFQNREPWDYPLSLLTTLCEDCHAITHGVQSTFL